MKDLAGALEYKITKNTVYTSHNYNILLQTDLVR